MTHSRFATLLLLFSTLQIQMAFSAEQQRPAKKKSAQQLTLERVFASSEFRPDSMAARWESRGDSYTVIEDDGGGQAIVRYDAATGHRSVLVDAAALTPGLEAEPLKIEAYSFSSGQGKVLIYTNSRRVWRRNTRGDYWVLDRATGELRQLGESLPESSLMFAKFSPDAHFVAYVCRRDIYLEDLRAPQRIRLTKAESPRIINGTFDWVYEEELGLRDGFRWSPDGRSIAYWQIDTTGVRDFPLVNNTTGLYPSMQQFAYPKVGEQNSICRVGVVDLASRKTRWLPVPGDPRNHYIARMDWHDAGHIHLQQLNRLQNQNKFMRIDIGTGHISEPFVDSDPAWVSPCDELFWLNDREQFTWVSERDGWRHVYRGQFGTPGIRTSADAGTCLTPQPYDVIQLLHVDEQAGQMYFIASPDDATCRYLYRQKIGEQHAERLTPAGPKGWHDYQISPNGAWALHTWSSTEHVPRTELIALPGHTTVRTVVDNQRLEKVWKRLKREPVEFFRVSADDGQSMDAWCMRPPGWKAGKKYPLLIYVYGEPAGSTVTNRWSGGNYLWHQMLAQQGYVVMSFDNRGTKVPRGREWRKSIYRQVGIIAPQDQAAAVREVLEQRPYLDATRVGVWGWSGGGSMTLNAMFKYPELYQTGIAIAPVPNQRYYDTIYQERYMGLPQDNPDGYRQGSPIHFAENLQGNLLLIHGTGDDNCHYQTSELLMDRLIRHNRPFSMMAYPNRTHSIREGENTTLHLRHLMTRYLHQHLPVSKTGK